LGGESFFFQKEKYFEIVGFFLWLIERRIAKGKQFSLMNSLFFEAFLEKSKKKKFLTIFCKLLLFQCNLLKKYVSTNYENISNALHVS
jgi:hypothetical protein